MPLLHISLRDGKPKAYRQAILDGLYRAMREALNVPEDDQFMTITEHNAANFRYGNAYGVARSADVVYIQITVFNTRNVSVEGPVVAIEPADVERDRRPLARRYLGAQRGDRYIEETRGEYAGNVLVRMLPQRWLTVDYAKA